MKRELILLLYLLLFLPSCAPVKDRRTLDEVESLIQEQPDSALAVLRDMKPRDFPGLHARSLHALLLSEALDKNYIDLSDDSLALTANSYYGEHGSKLHRLKSWYYLGRIRFNAGNYAESVICYNKALEYADELNNYHYIGLINREIANAYSEVWDDFHSEEYLRKSIDAFVSSGEKTYSAYSQLALARVLRKNLDLEGCDSVLNKMLDILDDDYLVASIYELKGLNALSEENPSVDEILSFYEKARIGTILPTNSTRLASLAFVQQLAGQSDSSDIYLNKARSLTRTKEDSITVIFNGFRQARLRLDYETAIDCLEDYLRLQDSSVSKSLKQSVSFYQSNYYMNESRIKSMKSRINALSFSIVIILLAGFILLLLSNIRKQRMQIVEEMARTAEIRDEIIEIKSKQEGMNLALATLFENRMKILQTLSDQYDLVDDKRVAKSRNMSREMSKDEIIDLFKNKMRELRKDKDIALSMEGVLDVWKDGIMMKLRSIFGERSAGIHHMTIEDLELIPYFFSGMKYKTISYLTGFTEHSLRERKRRIKQKIEALDNSFAEEKELFLSNL
ncbi:MAG: tetratricopeptide repeat protein [Bacteroidales bacterium]|nr:tetratricopeptide repeat protein [Bacteroidales bacterium]